ncbi:TPA: signal peptidase I [Listeria innocua]|nr:signal peptidase I [Listeria innocua]
MERFVVFLGSDFGELFNQRSWLPMNLLQPIVSGLVQLKNEEEKITFLDQLENFKNRNELYQDNELFLALIKNIQADLHFENSFSVESQISMIKKIVRKSFPDISKEINSDIQSFFIEILNNSTFIFSLHWQAYAESLMHSNRNLIVCEDRPAFLEIKKRKEETILFKLFGSFDKVEKMSLTQQEKEENSINFRLVISKAIVDDKVPVLFLGFRRKEDELKQILNELVSKNRKNNLYLFELCPPQNKSSLNCYTDKETDLTIQLISEKWEHELLISRNTKGKRSKRKNTNLASESLVEEKNQKQSRAVSLRRNRKKAAKPFPVKTTVALTMSFLCVLGFNLFFSIATIKGESMAPNFQTSDYVLFNKKSNKLNRFDVIAFASPDEPGQEYIKRVIGLPGDEIEYRDDHLYINGHLIEETYLQREKDKLDKVEKFTEDFSLKDLTGAKVVPQNKLFVLGDNRLYSRDSRNFGYIDLKDVKGNVAVKLWPIHIGGTR